MIRAALVFLAATIEFVVIGCAQRAAAGAGDHSGGIAGALEVARAPTSWPTAKMLRFRLFDFEAPVAPESGGSGGHVARLRQAYETFAGRLDFEMIGSAVTGAETEVVPLRVPFIADAPHLGDFISVIRSWCSGRLAGDFLRAVPTYVLRLCGFAVKCASAATLARVAAQ